MEFYPLSHQGSPLCLFFMYYLCEKYYKPITGQCYIAHCVSWVPRLTLLDLTNKLDLRTCPWNGTHSLCRGLTVFTRFPIFAKRSPAGPHSQALHWASGSLNAGAQRLTLGAAWSLFPQGCEGALQALVQR